MTDKVQAKVNLLVENRDLINKSFLLENSLIKIVASSIYTENERKVDADVLKECRSILRKKQGVFSDFRSNNEIVVSAKMAQQSDPEKFLDEIISAYKLLHEGKFFGSSYQVLAAINIVEAGRFSEVENIVSRTKALLKGMNKVHPFLTNDEDTCFAVLLAMTDKDMDTILDELEQNYKELKKSIAFHDNAVYSLAQVLTILEGESLDKVSKAVNIYNAFTEAGIKYGKDYELASLGALLNAKMDPQQLVSETKEASDFLKSQKGFGSLDIGKTTRLMFAAMIVASQNSEKNVTGNAAVIEGAVATVIAHQVAIMLAMVAISSSTAAHSSH